MDAIRTGLLDCHDFCTFKLKLIIMKKDLLVNVVNELPKEFVLEDLMEKLVVLEKIEAGLDDIKNGKTISHEKVKKEIKKWSK
jgi:hypothetical protein